MSFKAVRLVRAKEAPISHGAIKPRITISSRREGSTKGIYTTRVELVVITI